MRYKTLPKPEKWILKGIPWLFLIGSVMHFMYDICDNNIFAALFAPVNESTWEHLKMVLLPLILWWSLFYIIKHKQYSINKKKWFGGTLVALITALISIPLLYYFYTGVFGVHLIWVDILILLFSLMFGQLLGLHFYRYSKGISVIIVMVIFILLIVIFMVFTFNPPQLPIFQDAITGSYGIEWPFC